MIAAFYREMLEVKSSVRLSVRSGVLASAFATLVASTHVSEAYAEAVESPEELIRKMSHALSTLNYEGNFVHIQNGNVEAMRIVHSSDSAGELEYMLSLNGEAREVYRNRSLVTCIWPNSDAVILSDSKQRKILPEVDESLANSDTYELSIGEDDRVAGIDTTVVNIKPRDRFRYGYRFWVDKSTHMLLRSVLLDDQENVIEQVMFTNISYPATIPASRFETPKDELGAKLTQKINEYDQKQRVNILESKQQNRVDFQSLPAGYAEVFETYKPMPINDGPVSHVMLSDGMASVSVYVEYVQQSEHKGIAMGVSRMGAMNAYTHSTPSALITVVGEVPTGTVEAIALAVRLVE